MERQSDAEKAKSLLRAALASGSVDDIIDAVDALVECRIADFAEMMAERSEQLLGARL